MIGDHRTGSAGAVNASFSSARRYTGAATTANLAWLIGAGFAPLVALALASHFGLWSVGAYSALGRVVHSCRVGREQGLGTPAPGGRDRSPRHLG